MNLPTPIDVKYDCGKWIGVTSDDNIPDTCPECGAEKTRTVPQK
jgi:hypothetical protein